MSYYCAGCGEEVEIGINASVARKDTCASCAADLHACVNCSHYDSGAYNECKEPQAERVLEKDRSNFCDYFSFRELDSAPIGSGTGKKGDALKKLDDLFK